jgi:hypothetical protein
MALNVGGYEERPDWPKMGPSVLIATCLILAIRTAKWPPQWSATNREPKLDTEIEYAAHLTRKVLSHLAARHESIFPGKKVPWFIPDDEDVPK